MLDNQRMTISYWQRYDASNLWHNIWKLEIGKRPLFASNIGLQKVYEMKGVSVENIHGFKITIRAKWVNDIRRHLCPKQSNVIIISSNR